MAPGTSSTVLTALLTRFIIVCSFRTPNPKNEKDDLPVVELTNFFEEAINRCSLMGIFLFERSNKQKKINRPKNFSDLPDDILEVIVTKIELCRDFLSFTTVCKSWRCIAHNSNSHLPFNLQIYHFLPKKEVLPLLLQPRGEDGEMPYLYSTIEPKIYGGLHIPELRNKWISGCGNSWLVTVDMNNLQMNLLNPVTRVQISLPHVSTFGKPYDSKEDFRNEFKFVRRVYISSDPVLDKENCLIVAMVSNLCTLSFCRIGDDRWTKLEPSILGVNDVIMHKGLLYACNWFGDLFTIQISPIMKTTIVAKLAPDEAINTQYLVESSCKLLTVIRNVFNWKTTSFRLYELVETRYQNRSQYFVTEDYAVQFQEEGIQRTWKEMKNLNGKMLFVGYNQCQLFESRFYPGSQENCIYFADNDVYDDISRVGGTQHKHNIGVYHIERQFTKFLRGLGKVSSRMPSVWLSPNPW